MMMVEARSRDAIKNLQKGIRKMERKMTAAAQVRRDFQLGRPPRPLGENEQPQPLHPLVAWQKATDALADFRARMSKAKLNPKQAAAAIVYVEKSNPDVPIFLRLEQKGKSPEETEQEALGVLSRFDVLALGMIFAQIDEEAQPIQKAIFPRLFFGLNKRGMDVLKRAAQREYELGELLKKVN